jgi:hypothetical protein
MIRLGMMFTTWTLRRYNNELQTSEVFSTAGRSVKSGLVAAAVVSSWTWAATRKYYLPALFFILSIFFSSCVLNHEWYLTSNSAAVICRGLQLWRLWAFLVCIRRKFTRIHCGKYDRANEILFQATVQVILFATLAIELKRRAPNAHTFLEVCIINRIKMVTLLTSVCSRPSAPATEESPMESSSPLVS